MQVTRIARVTFGTVLNDPPNLVLGNETLPPATHSGHWNPTGALIMQSGQIVRSQRLHDTYASLSVWRKQVLFTLNLEKQ